MRPVVILLMVASGAGASAEQRAPAVAEASTWVSPLEGDGDGGPGLERVSAPGLDQRLFAIPEAAIVIPVERVEQATRASRTRDAGPETRLLASVHVPVDSTTAWERISAGAGRSSSSWRLAVVSEGASFLRAHFVRFPPLGEARVVVYGASSDQAAAVVRPARGSPDGGAWSPIVEGPVLFVEVETASGARPSVGVDAVSNGIPRARRTAAGCYLDPTCYGEWSPIKSGIGRLYFEDGPNGYVCSGALLTDRSHTGQPYFLTAHHCISEQSVADTTLVFWNYHTGTCNGLVPTLTSVPHTAGSSVLATSQATDFTLLLLDGDPPGGTAFLGWTTQPLPAKAKVAVIHHPAGDWKRISFGAIQDSAGGTVGQRFWLTGLSRGAVEGGSSGSPLFGPSHQVVGQLLGASRMGACDDPRVTTEFGKLGASWALGLSTYLNR